MLVAVWLPDAFRATRDLDLLGAGDASPERAEATFKDVCRVAVEPDGVEFDLGLIRFGGQSDYAACLSVNCLSNSAGLT